MKNDIQRVLLTEEQLDELDSVRAKFGITTGGSPRGQK